MKNGFEKILVSACLLGEKVRYHGGDSKVASVHLDRWEKEGRIVPLCPEVMAGFPTPRPPNEIIGKGAGRSVLEGKAKIQTADEIDNTKRFIKGAKIALRICEKNKIKMAILKDGSPSCGSNQIHDGTYSGNRVDGKGVVAALLETSGIRCFSEDQLEDLNSCLQELDGCTD